MLGLGYGGMAPLAPAAPPAPSVGIALGGGFARGDIFYDSAKVREAFRLLLAAADELGRLVQRVDEVRLASVEGLEGEDETTRRGDVGRALAQEISPQGDDDPYPL